MDFLKGVKKRKILLILLFIGYLVNFSFRNVVKFALLAYLPNDKSKQYAMEKEALLAFFIGYCGLQIPCGRLIEIIGGKTIIGIGMLGASVLSLSVPYAFHLGGLRSLVYINGLLGMCFSGFNAAFFALASKWIPNEERGSVIRCLSPLSMGNVVYVCIAQCRNIMSTEMLFIIPGSLGIIWFLFWYFLVYDTPLAHPSITREERNFIVLKKESEGTIYEVINCPWFEVVFDPRVWVFYTTHTFNWYVAISILTRIPEFLDETYHLNDLETPEVIMIPCILCCVSTFISGFLFDFLNKIGVPLILLQKVFTLIATIIPATMFIGFIWYQDSKEFIIFFYLFGLTFLTWMIGGYYTSLLDIAPNFSSTLLASAITVANTTLLLLDRVMVDLEKGLDYHQKWQNRHSLLGAFLFTCGTVYSIFGDSGLADWNTPYEYEAV